MEVLPSDKREQRPDERKSPHEYNTNKFYDVSAYILDSLSINSISLVRKWEENYT